MRAAVNISRRKAGAKKDYQDVFRRLRELQGEEGLLGIEKVGLSYQLVDAKVHHKRIPRPSFSTADFESVKARSGHSCMVCKVKESEGAVLVPDHKVPRSRLHDDRLKHIDGDSLDNLQALCQGCNILKSVACRGCQFDCIKCPWADPEANPYVVVKGESLVWLAKEARSKGVSPQDILETILREVRE